MVENLVEPINVSGEDANIQKEEISEPKATPESPKVEAPIINWEQKYKEIQRSLQKKDDELKRAKDFGQTPDVKAIQGQIANLEDMVAHIIDTQANQTDEYGNPKTDQTNAFKVKEARLVQTQNMASKNIQNMLKQYGLANDDPKLAYAIKIWEKGVKAKDADMFALAEEAVRNSVADMTPVEDKIVPKTPDDKANYEADVQKGVLEALKKLNINPALLKVDTYNTSQGAGNISDKDFLERWASGELPATSQNIKRVEKLLK